MKTKLVKTGVGKSFLLLTEGACSVKIYSSVQEKNGKTYDTHCVSSLEPGGKRSRKAFGDIEKAKAWAQVVLARLVNGQTDLKGMSASDFSDMAVAKQELLGLNVNFSTVAKEYRQAVQQLGAKGTINDAVRFYLLNATPDLPIRSVAEVAQELYDAKANDGLSVRYLQDIKGRLGKFAGSFPGNIGSIKTNEIEAWLRALGTGPKNRNNFAGVITLLFNFARRSGYLAADRATAAENLAKAKDVGGDVEIYEVDELTTILSRLKAFKPQFVPLVALGAFAGIRTAELARLEWEDVDFEQGLIEISAKNAKTAQRRHIPLLPNLAAWLQPYREMTGKIWPLKKVQIPIRKIIEPEMEIDGRAVPGVKWKPNALRHSYGSYRLPIVKSAAELALEMGNSPAMIFRHYRELVKPAEADKYWAIFPPVNNEF